MEVRETRMRVCRVFSGDTPDAATKSYFSKTWGMKARAVQKEARAGKLVWHHTLVYKCKLSPLTFSPVLCPVHQIRRQDKVTSDGV